jgi:hypothetical protein
VVRVVFALGLVAFAGALSGRDASAVGSGVPDLCRLPVQAKIKELALAPTCSVGPVSKLSGSAQERQVTWGTQGNLAGVSAYRSLGVVVYTGVSASTFANDYGLGSGTGVPVAVGQGGREEIGPHMIVLSSYAAGVGFEAVLQIAPQKATPDAGSFLAFAKIVASHV